ncbi:MAG: DUF3427 domain-containing protein [Pseudomonadota bacterium]|nr:DUF3427 domain-containing protein [Pseudomonadota bacterium]
MTDPLAPGLHERLLTSALAEALERRADLDPMTVGLDEAEAPALLGRHIAGLVAAAVRGLPLSGQLDVANQLLSRLASAVPGEPAADLLTPALLLSLARRDALAGVVHLPRPATPLNQTHLFINARGEHGVGGEIAREIASADRVDLLCSFLLWTGYLRLREALHDLLVLRRRPLRVLTTVYCGATDRRVLDALHAEGAQIKVSYDTRATRMHAKAWLLHRDTGYPTAFIGSSNLSAAALSQGLEWNVRIGADAPDVLKKFEAAFDGYWEDPAFEEYDPVRDAARFDLAIQGERGGGAEALTLRLQVSAFPFQQRILDQLQVEREVHQRWQNLVVAATGTGKTVIAALDFRRVRASFRAEGRPPRLLFVAHRKEILTQSRAVFRQVLQDGAFGGLFVDGERPRPGQDVFASVQSLARIDLATVDPAAWDVVIVDEFHHSEAPTYARLLAHLRPRLLLGLTATPERADGGDILRWFGGHVAVELRLWEAIDRGLLVPFLYFGLKDVQDAAPYWTRGRVDLEALDRVYSGHHARARQVLEEVLSHVADPTRMRAVGFCAGKAHARFMAGVFVAAGLPARALVDGDRDRPEVLAALRDGRLCAIFTVDLLNEGVDLPEVDTVLFLRPTESATVFLQQLGRGLRLCEGKRCLTVLDFIATADRSFRFDLRFRALVGGTRAELKEKVDQGFPVLPAGCSLTLAPDAAEVILTQLKAALSPRRDRLVAELRALGQGVTLGAFLDHTGLELEELYNGRSFTQLRREAGHALPAAGPAEQALSLGLGRALHTDDPALIDRFVVDLAGSAPPAVTREHRVLLATIDKELGGADPAAALHRLWANPALRDELRALLVLLRGRVPHVPLALAHPAVPLSIHCRYRLEQVMAAFDAVKDGALLLPREGVWFHEPTRSDVFFVTLQKAKEQYSPSTMYNDHAISPDLFHWQSQGRTTQRSERGQRNLEHRALGVTPLLFVRASKTDSRGYTVPYQFLGPVALERAEGERPIDIVWRLVHPIPGEAFEAMRVVG